MRTISSVTFVGTLLPPMNCLPSVGWGKIPAARSDFAFASIMQGGIVLFGNNCPGTIPVGGTLPGQFAPRLTTPLGTLIGTGNTAPVPVPPASGYSLANGTFQLRVWPWISLRHSML